jgi:hypothetical protein
VVYGTSTALERPTERDRGMVMDGGRILDSRVLEDPEAQK